MRQSLKVTLCNVSLFLCNTVFSSMGNLFRYVCWPYVVLYVRTFQSSLFLVGYMAMTFLR